MLHIEQQLTEDAALIEKQLETLTQDYDRD